MFRPRVVQSIVATAVVTTALLLPAVPATAVTVYSKTVTGKNCPTVLVYVDPNTGVKDYVNQYVRVVVSAGGSVKVYLDGRLYASRSGTIDTRYNQVSSVQVTSTAGYPGITVSCYHDPILGH